MVYRTLLGFPGDERVREAADRMVMPEKSEGG